MTLGMQYKMLEQECSQNVHPSSFSRLQIADHLGVVTVANLKNSSPGLSVFPGHIICPPGTIYITVNSSSLHEGMHNEQLGRNISSIICESPLVAN